MEAIELAIKQMGTATALARAIERETGEYCTPEAVRQWRKRGAVPPARVLLIERLTGVPRHKLRPDIYPPHEYAAE